MKQGKRLFTGGIVALMLVVTSVAAFAASNYTTPAEAIAGLADRTIDSVIAEKQENNKSYGAMAAEAGKLDDFKLEMFEIKKNKLKERVDAGILSQDKADSLLEVLEENQALCDGTSPGKAGQGLGGKFGFGSGNKDSNKVRHGKGNGMRHGNGEGQADLGNMNKGMHMYQ